MLAETFYIVVVSVFLPDLCLQDGHMNILAAVLLDYRTFISWENPWQPSRALKYRWAND